MLQESSPSEEENTPNRRGNWKTSCAICDAHPGAEVECRALLDRDVDAVVGDRSHRTRRVPLPGAPSVNVLWSSPYFGGARSSGFVGRGSTRTVDRW